LRQNSIEIERGFQLASKYLALRSWPGNCSRRIRKVAGKRPIRSRQDMNPDLSQPE